MIAIFYVTHYCLVLLINEDFLFLFESSCGETSRFFLYFWTNLRVFRCRPLSSCSGCRQYIRRIAVANMSRTT